MRSLGLPALALFLALCSTVFAQLPITEPPPPEKPGAVLPKVKPRTTPARPRVPTPRPGATPRPGVESSPIKRLDPALAPIRTPSLLNRPSLRITPGASPSSYTIRASVAPRPRAPRLRGESALGAGRTIRIPSPTRRAAPNAAAPDARLEAAPTPLPRPPAANRRVREQQDPAIAVVARVAGESMTMKELQDQLDVFTRDLKFNGPKDEKERLLRAHARRIIGDWIEQKLLAVEARRVGMQVAQNEMDAYIQGTAMDTSLMVPIQQRLRMIGMSEAQFAEIVTDAILGDKLIRAAIRERVTDAEIQKAWQQQPLAFTVPPKRQVRQIFYQAQGPEGMRDRETMYSEMKKIRRRLTWMGGKFEDYAGEEYSAKGIYLSDLGWLAWGEPIVPDRQVLYYEVFKTKPAVAGKQPAYALATGDISEILESSYGLHIIQVITDTPARSMTMEEARTSVESTFYERIRQTLLRELRTKLTIAHDLEGLSTEPQNRVALTRPQPPDLSAAPQPAIEEQPSSGTAVSPQPK